MLRRCAILIFLATLGLGARAQVEIRGLMDVVLQGDDDMRLYNRVNTGDSYIDPIWTKLMISSKRGQSEVHLQFLLSASSFKDYRIFGAYLLHQIWEDRDFYVEAGRIPIHDGSWASRSYSDRNPLVGIPLAYYWHSNLTYRMMPNDLDDLLAHRGQGQAGISYSDGNGLRGTRYASAPILYQNCWNHGLYLLGRQGRFDGSLGVTMGAPSSPVTGTDSNDEISLHARAGFAPIEGASVHLGYAQGAYLWNDVADYMPAGKTVNDYMQRLWIVSGEAGWDRYLFHGELVFNSYETPLREDGLSNVGYYLDGQIKLWPGTYLAARWDEIRFEEVEGTAGTMTWDQNVKRIEAGFGYGVSRDLKLKFVVQSFDLGDGFKRETSVPMIQSSLRF